MPPEALELGLLGALFAGALNLFDTVGRAFGDPMKFFFQFGSSANAGGPGASNVSGTVHPMDSADPDEAPDPEGWLIIRIYFRMALDAVLGLQYYIPGVWPDWFTTSTRTGSMRSKGGWGGWLIDTMGYRIFGDWWEVCGFGSCLIISLSATFAFAWALRLGNIAVSVALSHLAIFAW